MKKIIFVLSFALLLLGCYKKYPDDPQTMRFISVKKRLGGEWILYKIRIDGVDQSNLIYVDSLKIFSSYTFSHFVGTGGYLSVRTYNGSSSYNFPNTGSLDFDFSTDKKSPGIAFLIPSRVSWDTILASKTIIPYGPVNDFSGNGGYWKIQKLTKEDMHLYIVEDSQTYDLFFNRR